MSILVITTFVFFVLFLLGLAFASLPSASQYPYSPEVTEAINTLYSWLFHFNSIFPVDTLMDILQISMVYLVVFKLIMPFTIKIIGYVAGSNR